MKELWMIYLSGGQQVFSRTLLVAKWLNIAHKQVSAKERIN